VLVQRESGKEPVKAAPAARTKKKAAAPAAGKTKKPAKRAGAKK
jgi:hypothetical protein